MYGGRNTYRSGIPMIVESNLSIMYIYTIDILLKFQGGGTRKHGVLFF